MSVTNATRQMIISITDDDDDYDDGNNGNISQVVMLVVVIMSKNWQCAIAHTWRSSLRQAGHWNCTLGAFCSLPRRDVLGVLCREEPTIGHMAIITQKLDSWCILNCNAAGVVGAKYLGNKSSREIDIFTDIVPTGGEGAWLQIRNCNFFSFLQFRNLPKKGRG